MAENQDQIETKKDVDTSTAQDYIDAIAKLKASSVDRAEYEAVRAENKKLLDSLVNGSQVETEQPAEPTYRDPQDIRKELFDVDNPLSNLEYVSKAIELRDTLIAKGERDPFLPYGQNISPTDEDIKKANNVAEVFKHCIEYADGDDEVFTNELQRLTEDAMPLRGRRRN